MPRSLRLFVTTCGILAAFAARQACGQAKDTTAAPPKPPAGTEEQLPEILKANELAREGRLEEARELLVKVYEKYPDRSPADVVMASLFARLNQGALVRQCLERAVTSTPADPEAYMLMGDIARQEGRFTEAELVYIKAGNLLKDMKSDKRRTEFKPRIYGGIAAVHLARANWARAQEYLEYVLTLTPKDTDVLQSLAQALFRQKKTDESFKRLEEAYKIDSKNVLPPETRFVLFFEEVGDKVKAKEQLKLAVDKRPEDFNTRLVATEWCLQAGEVDEAQKHAAKALQLQPKSLRALVLRGVVALFQKKYSDAEEYFKNALQISPYHAAATNNLALALCEQDDNVKKQLARNYAEENARKNNRDVEAASTFGRVLHRLGQTRAADEIFTNLFRNANVTSPDTYYYFASVAYEQKRPEQARGLLETALKMTRPFLMRGDAEQLLLKIKRETPAKETTKKAG